VPASVDTNNRIKKILHNAESFLGGTGYLWAKCNHGKFQIAQDVFFSFRKYQHFKRSVIKDTQSEATASNYGKLHFGHL